MTASGSEAGFELLAILPSPETLKHDVSGLKRAKTTEYQLAFFLLLIRISSWVDPAKLVSSCLSYNYKLGYSCAKICWDSWKCACFWDVWRILHPYITWVFVMIKGKMQRFSGSGPRGRIPARKWTNFPCKKENEQTFPPFVFSFVDHWDLIWDHYLECAFNSNLVENRVSCCQVFNVSSPSVSWNVLSTVIRWKTESHVVKFNVSTPSGCHSG